MYQDYINYVKKYKEEYGEQCVVMYQCGSFYEVYSANDGLVNIKELSELLSVQLTRKTKAKLEVDTNNYNMLGFPVASLQKYSNILINNKYTVVVVDQVVNTDGKISRVVTEILSVGTKIDDVKTFNTNMLMLVYFDECNTVKTNTLLLSAGISIIDLTTGKSKNIECYSTEIDNNLTIDTIYKIISNYNPKEIVFGSSIQLKLIKYDEILAYLDIKQTHTHNKLNKIPTITTKISYQEQFLRNIFPSHGLLSVLEYLDLERSPLATISYVNILEFCYKHNTGIIMNMSPPETIDGTDECTISYNAAKHLNLDQLSNILNKCTTAAGKRAFKDRLMKPLNDVKKIEDRYDKISYYQTIYNEMFGLMDGLYDTERIARKISLGRLQPAELPQLVTTIDSILKISKISKYNINTTNIVNLAEFIKSYILLDIAAKYNMDNINESFFVHGKYNDIDQLQVKYTGLLSIFEQLAKKIHPEYAKVEHTDKDGYFISITIKRYNDIKCNLPNSALFDKHIFDFSKIKTKPISSSSTKYRVTFPSFTEINKKINNIKCKLTQLINNCYLDFLKNLEIKHKQTLNDMSEYIIETDWFLSCVRNVNEYKYTRPKIQNHGESSYFIAKQLRHPIIERILGQQKYITNDISVNFDNKGILLYGVNSSGKSSISKAVALCIIMAQCGMYTSCSEFIYYPYNEIFTRIPSGDNISKGQSTFVVEMSELRNILKRSTKHSLVIGDELASGTESVSALAIVTAGIHKLYNVGTSFIFATHLHDLCELDHIKKMDKLAIYHLSVKYDSDMKTLIYNRTLEPGPGDTIYGLEICKSLHLPSDFINLAFEVRANISDESSSLFSKKQSKYNPNVFINVCGICHNKAEATHHIQYQHTAVNGYIDTKHKNHMSNLVGLCNNCHNELHHNKLSIEGYMQTTDGIKLIYKKINQSK